MCGKSPQPPLLLVLNLDELWSEVDRLEG